MPKLRFAALLPLALALAAVACKGEDDDINWSGGSNVSAEGRAQEGKISIKAPGVDIAISLPKEMTGEARAGRDSRVLYPGSALPGMAVSAGENDGKGGETDVEMRFRTADPPEKVVAWYRDPARREGFRLTAARRDGASVVFEGIQKRDGHPFKVTVSPARGGGTEGRLRVHHKG
ncbi:MAG: hypothetical protein JOZ90_14075 [Alphaproteobacteria bacterium]|nr:hypothetical protein [Alphaproteobacteria bacterium]MBV9371590.1 hypothetical protein [Alphaproteobacteria bacterium]MBV9902199.1 hypothetical protein [Alphaproteobacteria bacterium]